VLWGASFRARLLLAALLVSASGRGAPAGDEAAPGLRLPTDVQPRAYALDLDADPAADRFAGTVTVTLALHKARRTIWLHGRGLIVSTVTARFREKEVTGTFTPVTADGIAKVALPEPLGPGEVALVLKFSAPFNTRNEGFFKVSYGGASYVMTQFEPLNARDAFPCFDEPSFKAPLALTLSVPAGLVAVANTSVEREEALPGGRKRARFKTTTPLSTYLYAWAVGPWDEMKLPALSPHANRARPLPLRGLSPRGHGPELAHSLALAPALLNDLETYFGIAYPFDKVDLLAAPDFLSGAMENAGLVIFRNDILLVDEHHAPLRTRLFWVMGMAHELAHQWFGDLVTLAWWDDIWLNEAFAQWLGFRVAARARPQYHYPLMLADLVDHAMGEDSLVSARRIRQPITSSGDVQNAFDSLTYQKGAALIAMFERYLGPEVFRAGIHGYLTAHANGSATVDDLLAALSQASGQDVSTPFKTFLDRPGVPLLEAKVSCGDGDAVLTLKQSRFLPVGSSGDTNVTWQLPVCARYGDRKSLATACTLLTTKEGSLRLPGKGCPTVVLPNAGGEGYYRWSLPARELLELTRAPSLTDEERLSLSHTLDAAYRAAAIPAQGALSSLSSLVADPEPRVAAPLVDLLLASKDHLVEAAYRPAVMKKAAQIFRPVLARVGLERHSAAEDVRVTARRAQAAYVLETVAEDPATRRRLAALGKAYLGVAGQVHPEALELSLGVLALTAALETDPSLFDAWVKRLETEQNPVVRSQLLRALASDRDPDHAERMRELGSGAGLPVSERLVPLRQQLRDFRTRPAAWKWLRSKVDVLAAGVSSDDRADLPALANSFCGEDEAKEVEALFRPRVDKLVGAERVLDQTLETIRLCAALVTAQRASATQFFAAGAPGNHQHAGAR
jgi:alanyl aminopeptidase